MKRMQQIVNLLHPYLLFLSGIVIMKYMCRKVIERT